MEEIAQAIMNALNPHGVPTGKRHMGKTPAGLPRPFQVVTL